MKKRLFFLILSLVCGCFFWAFHVYAEVEHEILADETIYSQYSIAGIEPSMGDLLDHFTLMDTAKPVDSALELQNLWLHDLKDETGPILLIAQQGKIRLMRLKRQSTDKPLFFY